MKEDGIKVLLANVVMNTMENAAHCENWECYSMNKEERQQFGINSNYSVVFDDTVANQTGVAFIRLIKTKKNVMDMMAKVKVDEEAAFIKYLGDPDYESGMVLKYVQAERFYEYIMFMNEETKDMTVAKMIVDRNDG